MSTDKNLSVALNIKTWDVDEICSLVYLFFDEQFPDLNRVVNYNNYFTQS